MISFLNKKIKFFLIPFFLTIFGIFIPIETVQAIGGVFDKAGVALEALDFVDIQALTLVFELAFWLTISQLFVHFAAQLLQWAMHLPIILSGNPLVMTGWSFILGLTNLFFLLFFVAIALCHILKIEIGKTFSTTKALTRLIIIALLVNFSLVFIGMFTDIAQIVLSSILASFEAAVPVGADSLPLAATQMLRDEIGRIAWGFFAPLFTYFAVAAIPYANVVAVFVMIEWVLSGEFIAMGVLAILVTILGLLMGLVFLIFALFFIARIVVIWLLAIISPLMMACWIFPSTEKYFKQWFNILIEWLFLGIVGIFVLLLGLANFAYLGAILGRKAEGIVVEGGQIFPQFGFAYIVLTLYLFITLYLMKKYLLPSGARDIMGKGQALLKGTVVPKLQKWGQKGGERIAKTAYEPKIAYKRSKEYYTRGRAMWEKTPIIGRMVGGIGAYEEETQKQYEETSKEMENASLETLRAHLSKRTITREDKFKHAVAAGLLIKRGDLSTEEARKHLRSAKNYGLGPDKVLKAYPHLAPEFGKTIQETVEKSSPKDFVKNVQPEALKNLETFYAMNDRKIEAMQKTGSHIQKKTLRETILKNSWDVHDKITQLSKGTQEEKRRAKELDTFSNELMWEAYKYS